MTYNVTGKFAPNENADVLNVTLTINGEANAVGKYTIEFAYDNGNYEIAVTEGVYAIVKREVTLKVEDVTAVYGEADTAFALTVINGSVVDGDDVNSLVALERTEGYSVGEYEIVCVNDKLNDNYQVKVTYTSAESSSYTIIKRSITLKASDVLDMPYTIDWQTLSTKFAYTITEGNLVGDDEISIVYKVIVKEETLDETNFSDKIVGGTHSITIIATADNYDITVIDGKLTITLPIVSLTDKAFGLVFIYGETQNAFDWQTMVSGYMPSASERTFKAEFFAPNDLTTPVALDGAGEYKMQIVIVHETEYSFADGLKRSEYIDVVVEKADISEKISLNVEGLTTSGYVIDSFGLTADAFIEGYDVELGAVLHKNGVAVTQIDGIGEYEFTATVIDANYFGEKSISFKVVLSAKEKIDKLEKLSSVENLTDADFTAAETLLNSLTKDDLLQIADSEKATEALEKVKVLQTSYSETVKSVIAKINEAYELYVSASDRSQVRFVIRNAYELTQGLTQTQKSVLSDDEKDFVENQVRLAYESSEKQLSEIIEKIREMLDEYNSGDEEKLFDSHDYIVALTNDDLTIVKDSEEGKEYARLWTEAYSRTQEAITISDKISTNLLFVVIMAVGSEMTMLAFAIAKMLGC